MKVTCVLSAGLRRKLEFSTDNESDLCFSCRVAKDYEDRRSHYEPSIGAAPDESEHPFKLEEQDFVPHYQRVSISGEHTIGVSLHARGCN